MLGFIVWMLMASYRAGLVLFLADLLAILVLVVIQTQALVPIVLVETSMVGAAVGMNFMIFGGIGLRKLGLIAT